MMTRGGHPKKHSERSCDLYAKRIRAPGNTQLGLIIQFLKQSPYDINAEFEQFLTTRFGVLAAGQLELDPELFKGYIFEAIARYEVYALKRVRPPANSRLGQIIQYIKSPGEVSVYDIEGEFEQFLKARFWVIAVAALDLHPDHVDWYVSEAVAYFEACAQSLRERFNLPKSIQQAPLLIQPNQENAANLDLGQDDGHDSTNRLHDSRQIEERIAFPKTIYRYLGDDYGGYQSCYQTDQSGWRGEGWGWQNHPCSRAGSVLLRERQPLQFDRSRFSN